jgi:chromosome segregation ATPase
MVCAYEQIRPILMEILQENRQLKEQIQQISEQCLKNHLLHIKELKETNQRLNTSIEQLGEVLYNDKTQLKDLKIEVQQIKELIMQDKNQINELQTETQREKSEITRVDERCNRHEIQINQLTDKINTKRGKKFFSFFFLFFK